MKFIRPFLTALAAVLTGLTPATAQVPDTLKYSIPAPPVGVQPGAQLGYSVAVEGGYTVVGAPCDDIGGVDAGVVKVFNSTTGALLFLIPNPSPVAGDSFGWSVAISGTRVVVGAHLDDTGATDAGSAYVYDLSSGTPAVPVASLNNPSAAARDNFGWSVAISGTRVVVGARYDDTGAIDAGSAYVYDLGSGTPAVPVATLHNPRPTASGRFGSAVAISGTRVVVGALYDDTDESYAGGAYVYDLSSGTPTVPVAALKNPSPEMSTSFGWSVAISGTRVVVGAWGDGSGLHYAGSAYVYDLSNSAPTVPVATLNNPSQVTGDNFGFAVAISGTRVVVGAYQDDTGAIDAGSAYVYDLSSGTPTVPVATFNNPSPEKGDNFGYSVAISGTRAVVGAFLDRTGADGAGSAYVYDLSNATPTVPLATLNNPNPAVFDFFGSSVAISGTRVVVGADADDLGAVDAGAAYVYDLASGTPIVPVATLNKPNPAKNDRFGFPVAIDGTTVAIGTPLADSVAKDKGAVYVFGPASNDTNNNGLLDLWEYAKFGTLTGHLALDDTDGDGTKELVEEAFNTDPLLPTAAAAPAPVVEGGFLTLTVNKRAGVTYVVESAGTPLAADFSSTTTTVLTNTAAILKVRDNVPATTPGGRFMRVRVTASP